MKSRISSASLFFLIVLFASCSTAWAQLAVEAIGTDPVRNQDFSCIRFTNTKQNTIEITKQNTGATRTTTIKKARRAVQQSIKKTNRRIRKQQPRLRALNKQINKITKKIFVSEKNRVKLERLQARRDKVQTSVEQLRGAVASLKETVAGINRCSTDDILSAGVQVISGIVTDSLDREIFYVGAYFPLDGWNPSLGAICVQESRFSFVTGYTVFPPTSCLRTDPGNPSQCLVTSRSEFGDRYFVSTIGRSGFEKPGTCPNDPGFCSRADALAEINDVLSSVSFQVLGAADSVRDCG